MMLYLFIAIAITLCAFVAWRAHADGRLDLTGLFRRASTWLGILTAAQGGAILAFSAAPPEIKSALPPTLAGYLLVGMMLCGAATGVATSIQQKLLPPGGSA